MLLLCTTAACVRLSEITGGQNYLDVILMSCFMVVTCHGMLYFLGNPFYLLVFLPLSALCPMPVFDHLYVHHVLIFCW